MTQTVDIEDSRSDDDGGTLVSGGSTETATATVTTKAPAAKTNKKTKK